ncbi:MAG: redoxin domain-containing protein [Acidobacteria bacterium]|nr:redoxin domain-containing protein [Acidobacteriota bacterium]
MRLWLIFVGLGVLWTNSAQAQVSRLEPAQPRWGQTLTISYDSATQGAKFSAADDVYGYVRLKFPDHVEHFALRMAKVGKQHRAEFKVKDNVAEIGVHFLTLGGGWDEWAYTTVAVHRADGQLARGALVSKISSGRYLEFFKQETALYPDNYSAYRAKWETAALIDAKKAAGEIQADLKRLSRLPENAELLYALSFGYLLTGREADSVIAIRRLAGDYASSPFAGLAIKDYEEQIENLPAADRSEVARLKLQILRANPASEFARLVMATLAADSRAPLDVMESISGFWQKAEPENPLPNFYLAMACLNRYQNYGLVKSSLERAIESLLAGKLRLHGDINGKQSEMMLPEAYRMMADLLFRQQQFGDALAVVETAKAFARETDFGPHLLEAKIQQAIGKNTFAETAFLEAWRRGSQEAEERLKDIYKGRRGSLAGFDEYLLAATKGNKSGGAWKQIAPQVKLTTLDGKRYDLNALTGKVVVINLWFIGCSPCRKEIPRLNELVNEFSRQPVVFLAPTFDSAETLREFLKQNSFDYQIVPDAETIINTQFNASLFPTHIVIDQNGFVEATLVGASERRPEEVRRLILRLLNAPVQNRER